jgi:hypothetical protein
MVICDAEYKVHFVYRHIYGLDGSVYRAQTVRTWICDSRQQRFLRQEGMDKCQE